MTLLSRNRLVLDPLKFSTGNRTRTRGLHLTDIIRDVQAAIGGQSSGAIGGRRGNKNAFTEEQLGGFQLQGYLWERIAEAELRELLEEDSSAFGIEPRSSWCPGEMAYDGAGSVMLLEDGQPAPKGHVLLSPDRLIWREELGKWRLGEMKWTTKSAPRWVEDEEARKLIIDQWLRVEKPGWLMQVQPYMLALSVYMGVLIDEVEWHVQFPCGDYYGSGVQYEMWVKKFDKDEIWSLWTMLWDHAHERAGSVVGHPWREWL